MSDTWTKVALLCWAAILLTLHFQQEREIKSLRQAVANTIESNEIQTRTIQNLISAARTQNETTAVILRSLK